MVVLMYDFEVFGFPNDAQTHCCRSLSSNQSISKDWYRLVNLFLGRSHSNESPSDQGTGRNSSTTHPSSGVIKWSLHDETGKWWLDLPNLEAASLSY